MTPTRLALAATLALGALGFAPPAFAASNSNDVLLFVPCADPHADPNHPAAAWQLTLCSSAQLPGAPHGDIQSQNGLLYATIYWLSGNNVVYTENGPFTYTSSDPDVHKDRGFWLKLDGNHDATQFATYYDNPATSVLVQPNLHFQIWQRNGDPTKPIQNPNDPNQQPYLVTDQTYRPIASALYAVHSLDSVGLAGEVAAETARAEAAEAALGQSLANETSARIMGDAQDAAALNAEIAARMAADNAEMAARIAGDQVNAGAIASETGRAEGAEAQLNTNLNNEITRAQGAEALITTNLNSEITRAKAAETVLTTNLNNEVSRAKAAEALLSSNLAGETARAEGAEGTLNTAVNNEAARAMMSEAALASAVTAEAAARQQGDAATLAASKAYTDANTPWQKVCAAGQINVSTGPGTWACGVVCSYGTADCDNNPDDGCEVSVTTDPSNCGGCGTTCSGNNVPAVSCSMGACNGACAAGFADCNNNKQTDGCETSITTVTNCGACGVVCAANQTCNNGVCGTPSPLTNGSFETGDYTGWTLTTIGGVPEYGTFGIATNGQTIASGASVFDYHNMGLVQEFTPGLPYTYASTDGNDVSVWFQNGSQEHRMYQTVTIPANATNLLWSMSYNNHFNSFNTQQQITINVRDPNTDAIIATIFQTVAGDPLAVSPIQSFSASVAAFQGQTVRIDIDMNVQDLYFDASYDNFRLQ